MISDLICLFHLQEADNQKKITNWFYYLFSDLGLAFDEDETVEGKCKGRELQENLAKKLKWSIQE